MNVKEESEKAGLKFNIQKTKIMLSSFKTSCLKDGETMETVTDYFLGLQNQKAGDFVDGGCGLWMVTAATKSRRLLPGRKAMTNLDRILKSRDFVDKSSYSQSYGFCSSHAWM